MSSGTYNGKRFVVIYSERQKGEKYLTVRFKDGAIGSVKESSVTYDPEEPLVFRISP